MEKEWLPIIFHNKMNEIKIKTDYWLTEMADTNVPVSENR